MNAPELTVVDAANRVAKITLAFWIMKICATTLGETAGDLLSMTLAVGYAASSLILVHNHPSGSPEPSRADIQITGRIAEAGRLLGITVHDHVIVGREGHVSLRAKGLI